jgi:hypothetical protein
VTFDRSAASFNGAPHPDAGSYAKKSPANSHRIIKGCIGDNQPQEAP